MSPASRHASARGRAGCRRSSGERPRRPPRPLPRPWPATTAVVLPPCERQDKSVSYDLLIVGGGIHGAGIARDAAGRGLSVLLVEQHSLASHTSSASSKL